MSTAEQTSAGSEAAQTLRLLRWIAVIAIADLVLLIVLVIAALSDAEGVVSVVGPIHGIGFLIELFLAVKGAGERRWGWWFPAVVLVTTGPPGALIGHIKVTRDLREQGAAA